MLIVAMAWLYVALMMAVAEATSTSGSVLGAMVTFVLYGLLPVLLVLYLMGTPARKKAIRLREAQEASQASEAAALQVGTLADATVEPDASNHAPAAAETGMVAPVREKP